MSFKPMNERSGPCQEDHGDDTIVLRRFLGLIPTISFILGMIVGTGIFLTPAGVLRGASGSIGISFAIWTLGAIIQLFGALSMTELALFFRQSGGGFVFLYEVYGPAAGFLNTIMTLLINLPTSSAVQSLVIVEFLITPFIGDCDPISEYGYRAAASCVFMLAVVINCISTSWTSRTQVFLTFIKVAALLLIIIAGLVNIATVGTEKLTPSFDFEDFDWSKLPSGFLSAYWAYGGWANIANVTEEVKQPNKTVIRGMVISIAFTSILYLLANLAYFAVLTPEEIMASDAVAALFAVRVFGVRWSFIIWLCVVLSASGNLNGGTFATSRVHFVAARTGCFPFILSTIHIKRRTPVAAILCTLPTTILIIWSGNVWSIINFNVFVGQVIFVLTIAAVPYLRWKRPNEERPYKVPLWGCIFYIIFNVALIVFTVITDPMQMLTGAASLLICIFLYYIYEYTGKSPRAAVASQKANHFLQKLLLSVKQEADTF